MGSCYIDHTTTYNQQIFKVKVADTTAAGDTYLGYFVASMMKGKDVKEALKLASKASSIAISRVGAAPSIPCMQEVVNQLELEK